MNFKTAPVKLIALSFLIFANIASVNAQPESIYRIPAGTRIRLKMDVELSSKVASVNDTFVTTIAKPVIISDSVALPAGTVIEGRVSRVSRAEMGRHNGLLDPVFESLRLMNTSPIRIDGVLVHPVSAPSSSMLSFLSIAGGTAIGAVLGAASKANSSALIGAGVGAGTGTGIALLRKGKDVRIKSGEEFEIELKREIVLPVLDY